jgi:putative ABC transport system permease protein
MAVDYDFFETYQMSLLAGRRFSRDLPTDVLVLPSPETPVTTGAFVLNESAARLLGWSAAAATNRTVDISRDDSFSSRVQGTVIGIVGDTYFESIEVPLRPLIYVLVPPVPRAALPVNAGAIRVSTKNLPATLAHIDATWHALAPEYPVDRHFLSRDFDALYASTDRQAALVTLFSALAIAIACVGLFGLASLTTEQRTKEIGIRKAVGGSVTEIVLLFCREFGVLVLLANVVAWPVAYLLMRRWLDQFAYRIDVNPLVFALGALVTLALALMTVGIVAARAANADPVRALRYE